MFWICAENTVNNTGMFSLLMSSAYTVKSFCTSHLTSEEAGGTRSWKGTQLGQLAPTDPMDIPDHLELSYFAYNL